MAAKATYENVKKEFKLMLQYKQSAGLFGKEFYLPLTGEDLMRMLEDNNLVGEFCYILYRLQNTNLSCLDDYEFYLEYKKDSSPKNCASHFSIDDLSKMCNMCKEFKYRNIFMIGILLYKGYEPDSIYEFFSNYYIADYRPEAIAALEQEEELERQAEELIRRDKELMHREQEIEAHKPLKEKAVRERIMYSPYSNWGIKKAVTSLRAKEQTNKKCFKFQNFISILYTLQYANRNLKIFDKVKFKDFVKNYWCKFYEEGDFYKRAYGYDIRFLISRYKYELEQLTSNPFEYSQKLGGFEYKAKINNLKDDIKKLEEMPYSYYCEEFYKIIPDQAECDKLWEAYTYLENTLVFSIAILLHEKASDWERVLGYYLTSGEHVKIAEHPIQGKEMSNPYIVHPKLKRPINKKVINRTHFIKPNKTVSDIISDWKEKKENANRYALLLTIFALQMGNIILINEDTFNNVFQKQIEIYKLNNSVELLSFNLDDDNTILPARLKDKENQLREITILIDIDYEFNDIYTYYKE